MVANFSTVSCHPFHTLQNVPKALWLLTLSAKSIVLYWTLYHIRVRFPVTLRHQLAVDGVDAFAVVANQPTTLFSRVLRVVLASAQSSVSTVLICCLAWFCFHFFFACLLGGVSNVTLCDYRCLSFCNHDAMVLCGDGGSASPLCLT